jgi:hypothetical protein
MDPDVSSEPGAGQPGDHGEDHDLGTDGAENPVDAASDEEDQARLVFGTKVRVRC